MKNQGFPLKTVEVTGELQERVERGYVKWCVEVGVPPEKLKDERRFFPLLEWVGENLKIREKLVKTGWKKWRQKWRKTITKEKHFEL